MRKYGSSHVWTYFTDMFDFLTLSVVIDDKIFCVHGGEPFLAFVGGALPTRKQRTTNVAQVSHRQYTQ